MPELTIGEISRRVICFLFSWLRGYLGGPLAYWSAGLLVCWFTGLLEVYAV